MTPDVGRGQPDDFDAPGRRAVARRALGSVTPASRNSAADSRNGHTAGTEQPGTRINSGGADSAADAESSARGGRRGGARQRSGPARRWKPPADAPRRLLSLAETASYLGVSPWTVRDLQWKGRLSRVALSRKLLFDRADLDRLIEAAKE